MANQSLDATKETREERFEHSEQLQDRVKSETVEQLNDVGQSSIQQSAISTLAKYILDALELREEKLRVLDRHDIILSAPEPPDCLDSQKQFDAYRGYKVFVQTVDPWNSNRCLTGTLVERNAMDVIINVKGRLVTIPNNFIAEVYLPPSKGKATYNKKVYGNIGGPLPKP